MKLFKKLRFKIRLRKMVEDKWLECQGAEYRFENGFSHIKPEIIYWQHNRLVKIYVRNFENRLWY